MGAGPAAVTFVTRHAAYPNERARAELGWRPQVTLDVGMARTREWAREAGLLDR
jgi:nucleoside-diphosphate-sugar epimerase